jgi:hemolysin activation/secretion protein
VRNEGAIHAPGGQVILATGPSVELIDSMTPNLFASKDDLTTTLRLLGFADAGKVFNRLDTPCRLGQSRCSLAAIGLGARLGYRSLQLKLDLAHALKNANTTGRGDTRLHFQAIYAFL